MATQSLCSVSDCGKPAVKRGWCGAHYRRWQRHGDTSPRNQLRAAPGSRLAWIKAHARHSGVECLTWPFAYDPNGYGQICEGGIKTSANRAMCLSAHGQPPTPEHEAAHSCGNGNGGCLNPTHLRWALPVENQADRIAHDTHIRGDRAPAVKLTEREVLEIRNLYGSVSAAQLGRRYGVSKTAILKIHNRTNWGWL